MLTPRGAFARLRTNGRLMARNCCAIIDEGSSGEIMPFSFSAFNGMWSFGPISFCAGAETLFNTLSVGPRSVGLRSIEPFSVLLRLAGRRIVLLVVSRDETAFGVRGFNCVTVGKTGRCMAVAVCGFAAASSRCTLSETCSDA